MSIFSETTISFLFKEVSFFKRKVALVTVLWFILGLLTAIAELLKNSVNNFLIFRGVFWHTWQQTNLYLPYVEEYADVNHYGPFFSVVIAPFSILPVNIAVIVWVLVNSLFYYYAIQQLPFSKKEKIIILWICLVEHLTAFHNIQFNHAIAAFIILAYCFVSAKKDFWAALCIMAGFFIKLYGIVGLAFFFMSKRKTVFFFSCLFWAAIAFVLPMLISSPGFILQTYHDWYQALVEKNDINTSIGNYMQDISLGGMIRRISHDYSFNEIIILAGAAFVLLLETIAVILIGTRKMWLLLLSSLLLSVVLFSSSSESPTYIIAVSGVAVWFILSRQDFPRPAIFLLIFVLLFTSISSTDLVPYAFKSKFIIGYSLKALGCFLVWVAIAAQTIFYYTRFLRERHQSLSVGYFTANNNRHLVN
ncbi:MAG: glycosyltransferase family 87 protein [Bacteroidota bacterium]|nr:glycosyltransferase family 87 protein [Bacteroidota bacterium]